MAIIRCQACGKPNPDFLEVCQYCDARLKPLTGALPPEPPPPGQAASSQNVIRCQACGKPNPAHLVVCQFCDARLKPLTAELRPTTLAAAPPGLTPEPEAPAEPEAVSPPPGQQEPDWLWTGAAAEETETPPAAAAEEAPDWLSALRGEESAGPEASAPADEAPDWLRAMGGAETAQPAASPFEAEATPEAEIPDWLRTMGGAEPAEPEAVPTPSEEVPEWLRSMQAAEPAQPEAAPFEAEAAPAEEVPDWLRAMGGAEPTAPEAAPAPSEEVPDWLRSMQAAEPAQPEAAPFEAEAAPAEEIPDWLRAMGPAEPSAPESPPAPQEMPTFAEPPAEAGPDWLSSLHAPEAAPPETEASALPPTEAEAEPDWLQALRASPPPPPPPPGTGPLPVVPAFAGMDAEAPLAEEVPAEPAEAPSGELPDWLASLRPPEAGAMPAEMPPTERPAVIADEAAAADLAQAALPSWLQALRPVDIAQPVITPETDTYEETVGVLAGMRGVLQAEPTVAQPRKSTAQVHKMEVSEAEAAQADLLTRLLNADSQAWPAARRRTRLSLPLERWLVSAVLFAAVILPLLFLPGLFALPTSMAREAQAAYDLIEGLPTDKPALVAFDYEPAQTGELNPAAEAMVGHLLRRGVPVVAVSARPAGAAIGDEVLNQVTQSLGETHGISYTYGLHYLNLGYIPGGPVGLLQFAAQPRSLFNADFRGNADVWTQPIVAPLAGDVADGLGDDFGLILLVAATPASARAWIEQTQNYLGETPMLAVVSAGAEPMVRPYYETRTDPDIPPPLRGLVSGLIGAAQYEQRAGAPGAASARWDALGGGLLAAAAIIAAGNVVHGAMGLLRRRKG